MFAAQGGKYWPTFNRYLFFPTSISKWGLIVINNANYLALQMNNLEVLEMGR